ncbi:MULTISPECIES: DUF4388 domain-containing protein [Cyanophyceae]|uniref:DUF4388 domain-containing protein n=1 Tax=Cyanophyceae TaxID=3028117 RepID=UPI00232B7C29|nr:MULTISPECIES: DUF4388 domain-containing protein [Cyanophyceae]MDB9358429.1 DUF4388 domain-containing protein [Nodularia spumigena CS-587/03]MDB9305922.1 DUF4388 domain-containing protein [Nodularia spumigena CS-591/12]MDB9319887.1 DUF4388 domain-containing protein [Nodularia spumigena CS-590/01A]MDB9320642.1 DUF4388 domain-containing protein [Nodularia spumigena CS-591/07A]MDB9327746.1 DUF4388 domain-containing protein [Nodularia spumigena CS-590/02]
MAITGNFTDFSLPELLHFLDHGKKTGLLAIELPSANSKIQHYYIWLHQGRVIAAADRLDEKGLTLMIAQRGWISERVISRVTQICPTFINTPLGLSLKSQGLLEAEQLKQLFKTQVIRQISSLFQAEDGSFTFKPTTNLPIAEMTGLSMSATEVILMGLRSLRNWTALADKLPDATSGLSSLIAKQPQIQLNAQEWQLWEFVNGEISLHNIATHLRVSVETVQQIAFRLIVVGLVEEHFMVATSTPTLENSAPAVSLASVKEPPEKQTLSQSFFKSLVGFLRSR